MAGKENNAFELIDLDWDTDFFGVKAGKAILTKSLKEFEWCTLRSCISEYDFVVIENKNSDPDNARILGTDTSAFIVDTNIQFAKSITICDDYLACINVFEAMDNNEDIIGMSDYKYSRFLADPFLRLRGGKGVYSEWLKNSFNMKNKYFAIYKDVNSNLCGYALFSFSQAECIIELIAVSNEAKGRGIGESMFQAVEKTAIEKKAFRICVGTQSRNIQAINFYSKVGCRQVGCHQIFHLWNI